MAQTAAKSCEICASAAGQYQCQQCDQLFCQNCKVGHLKTKMTKNHTFTSGDTSKIVKTYCKQHDELFIYQCIPCNTQVCRICVLKTHNGHKMTDSSEFAEKLRKEVNKEINDKIAILESNTKQLEKTTKQYQQEVKTVIAAINDEGSRLKKLVDKKVVELIQWVKGHESRQLKEIIKAKDEFKRDLENIKKLEQQFQTFQQDVNDETFNKRIDKLKSNVEEITVEILTSVPTMGYSPKQMSHDTISNLFGALNTSEIDKSTYRKKLKQKIKNQSKTYIYECYGCGTQQSSDQDPYLTTVSKGAHLYCDECEKNTWHVQK